MAQHIVEIIIGRLVADEQFRLEFLANPEGRLQDIVNRGLNLTHAEIDALVRTDRTLWARTANALDPRLQKATLKHDTRRF